MRKGDLTSRVATGTFWVSVETWGGQLIQLGIFVVLSRLLGPEAYGLIGLAVMVNLCAEVVIVGGGWGDAIVRRPELTREHEASIFFLLVGLSLALALLVVALAGPAARLFGAGDLTAIMPWLALGLPISALGVVPRALLRRDLHFAPLAMRSLVALVVAGGAAIALAAAGAGVWSLVVFHLAQPAASAAVIWIATGWRPPVTFSIQAVKDVLPFVSGALGDRAVAVGDAILQRTVIGLALGPVALGLYTFARKISELLLQLVTRPLARVLLPMASQLQRDNARLQDLVGGAAAISGLVILPTAAGVAIVAPELVPLVFGQSWVPVVPVLQALMFVTAAAPFTQITASAIYASGASRWQFALSALATLVLGMLLLLYGVADLNAVTAALVTRTTLMLPTRMLVARHATGIDIPQLFTRASRPLAATLLMTAVLLLVREFGLDGLPALTRLILSILIGAVVYLAAAALLARSALNGAIALAGALRR